MVDGSAIKADPLSLFQEGKQDKDVEVMVGDVAGEGLLFVPRKKKTIPPSDYQDFELIENIRNALQFMSNSVATAILKLYPENDSKYRLQTERLADIAGQALVQCNARGIATASDNNTYNYFFKRNDLLIPLPLLHGQDVPYTFYDTPETSQGVNKAIAENWQKYVMGFVLEGRPNLLNPKTPMNRYGEDAKVIQFDFWNITVETTDQFKGPRCDESWPEIWAAYGEPETKASKKVLGLGQDELR